MIRGGHMATPCGRRYRIADGGFLLVATNSISSTPWLPLLCESIKRSNGTVHGAYRCAQIITPAGSIRSYMFLCKFHIHSYEKHMSIGSLRPSWFGQETKGRFTFWALTRQRVDAQMNGWAELDKCDLELTKGLLATIRTNWISNRIHWLEFMISWAMIGLCNHLKRLT